MNHVAARATAHIADVIHRDHELFGTLHSNAIAVVFEETHLAGVYTFNVWTKRAIKAGVTGKPTEFLRWWRAWMQWGEEHGDTIPY